MVFWGVKFWSRDFLGVLIFATVRSSPFWWDSARVCLYYVNDNDNDNDGARFYSKSNANNSIVNYAVLLFISTLTVSKVNDCVKLICRNSK